MSAKFASWEFLDIFLILTKANFVCAALNIFCDIVSCYLDRDSEEFYLRQREKFYNGWMYIVAVLAAS